MSVAALEQMELIPSQAGRTVLITGANSGLGRRSALVLAARGARVLLACRDAQRGLTALEQVRAEATAAEPHLVRLDLGDLASVKEAADEVSELVESLDVLMNNAGVMALPPSRSADGHEAHLAINHLGHFALTLRLLATLLSAPEPRVVTVASLAHWTGRIRWNDLDWQRRHYWPWLAYSQSKLANVLFMRELDRRVQAIGLPLISVGAHPGGSKTDLQRHVGGRVRPRLYGAVARLLQSDVAGAMPQLVAATDTSLPGGSYLGPQHMLGVAGPVGQARMSPAARDPHAARRLWETSERLTGERFEVAVASHTRSRTGGAR